MPKFSARAERLKRAAALLYGPRGGTRFAETIGISKQLWSFIARGVKPVTDAVERKASEALRREAKRLRAAADRLDEMAEKMKEASK